MNAHSTTPLGEAIDEYAVRFEATDHDEVSTVITNTVAKVTGRSPERVGSELTSLVDGDALDRLFAPARDEAPTQRDDSHLLLSVAGCLVTVAPDGTVTVTPADRAA